MSVYASELNFYGSADMPEADGATVGGAVDFSKKVTFYDLTATGALDYFSSSASDTATKITLSGRDGTGVIQNETVTLNGTTQVAGSISFQRILYAASSGAGGGGPLANPGGTTAVGDLCAMSSTRTISGHTARAGSADHTGTTPPLFYLQAGDGASCQIGMVLRITGGTGANQIRSIVATSGYGTDVVAVSRDWSTIPDATSTYDVAPGLVFDLAPSQVTQVIRTFAAVASDTVGGSTREYYEKVFAVNTDTATALTAASIVKQTDPAGLYTGGGALDFALTSALDDTGTVANRQTAPASGITAFSSGAAPQTIAVPGPQNLPSGAVPNAAGAQGVWWRLTLPAGLAPGDSSFTQRVTGQTT